MKNIENIEELFLQRRQLKFNLKVIEAMKTDSRSSIYFLGHPQSSGLSPLKFEMVKNCKHTSGDVGLVVKLIGISESHYKEKLSELDTKIKTEIRSEFYNHRPS